MRVSNKIKDAIRKCAKYNAKANYNERIVHKWLENNKLTEETAEDIMRNLDDNFIDSCLYTNNAEEFIKDLEELEG